ncbi:acyl carrier protein [Burkholderia ubonensis]|uniref:acyl carrier protein n=1 Tax=Burkholderia ubonensis TaxID=101571 RepID=UPI002AB2E0C5|nr:acyl carrier protein [Burkholderia ubonensis]
MNDQPLILAPAVAPEQLRAQLIGELRAAVAATLHVAPDAPDAPDVLDADLPLADAGLTSVELIDLIVSCQARHAIEFPPELLVGLTLGSLADGILAARDAGKGAR